MTPTGFLINLNYSRKIDENTQRILKTIFSDFGKLNETQSKTLFVEFSFKWLDINRVLKDM